MIFYIAVSGYFSFYLRIFITVGHLYFLEYNNKIIVKHQQPTNLYCVILFGIVRIKPKTK